MEEPEESQHFNKSNTCDSAKDAISVTISENETDPKSECPQSSEMKDDQSRLSLNGAKANKHNESYEDAETSSFQDASTAELQGGNASEKKTNNVTDLDGFDNMSDTSEFSDLSEESWHPVQGPIAWVQEQMRQGHSPRKILEDLVPAGTHIPDGLDPIMLWKIIINIVSEPPKRSKLDHINTLDDVVHLLKTSQKIMVLTGAGVSVSCGIPDFRSRDGVYARLSVDFPNLPDPQAMFDIHFFRTDPRPFFKFAKEIYPGQFQPSPCHKFIRLLEKKGKLLRNYTQNIDTLEQVAGITRAIQCHGSFATATCAVCGLRVSSDEIKEDIFKQVIPLCPKCPPDNEKAVMKPDIVFFGESLPEDFHNQMAADKDECDLLIVIGSSLKVRPVALIPNSLPPQVPQILINRERLNYLGFDVELLGNCDDIVGDLCRRLGEGWDELAAPGSPLKEVDMASLPPPPIPSDQSDSPSLSPAKTSETLTSESNKLTDTPNGQLPHCSNMDAGVSSDNQDSKQDQTSSKTSSDLNCTGNASDHQCDPSQTSSNTGSINCGLHPHHTQDVMFCPNKRAPHSLTQQQIAKCSSDISQVSSKDQDHHVHHHTVKRKSDSVCEETERNQKHQKIEDDKEQINNPGVSNETADDKYLDCLEMEEDEAMKMWKSKHGRVTLAQRLSDDQVLFLPPCRYVFKGAEVFSDSDSEDSDDSSSGESCEEEEEEDQEESKELAACQGTGGEDEQKDADHAKKVTSSSTHSERKQPSTSAVDPTVLEEQSSS